jgi:hypothetical protein
MLGTALRCSASGKATGALLLSYRSGVGDDSYRSRYPFFLHLSVKSDGTREIAKGVDHSPQVGNNLWITGHQRARPYWAVVEKASRPSRHRVGSPMESISGAACTYLLRGRSGHAALGSGCSACRKTCEAPGPALSYPSRGWGARGGSVMAAPERARRAVPDSPAGAATHLTTRGARTDRVGVALHRDSQGSTESMLARRRKPMSDRCWTRASASSGPWPVKPRPADGTGGR